LKILILSFYYQPDLSAGSFRCTSIVEHLAKFDVDIEVVTTMPNRYASFITKASSLEEDGNVRVNRISLPPHNSGIIDQIRAFIIYYRKTQKFVKNQEYDIIYATSSRLFTAFLGARIAKTKGLPLYLDVRDIFADTINDILPRPLARMIKAIVLRIEQHTFIGAKRINLVSRGFTQYFQKKYPDAKYKFFTNGIDKEFIESAPDNYVKHKIKPILTVLYAGNIGQGQGLHHVIPELAGLLKNKVLFKIIGDGGKKRELEYAVRKQGLENVKFLLPVSRANLVEEYKKADVLFLHLNDHDAFKKVLPSKLFEYAAMGKPIWAGLSGFSSKFIESEISNCQVFLPTNALDAITKLDNLNLDVIPRNDFNKRFSRENIMRNMALDIMEFVESND